MENFHLAEINIARAVDDLESDTMAGFVARLDEINALADRSPGFVWRLQTEEGDATALRVFDDPRLIINMSVWADLESLKRYVYQSVHVELLKNKAEWFGRMAESHLAMWWVPAGHLPTVEEGKERLEMIRRHGPGAGAFTFSHPWQPPGADA